MEVISAGNNFIKIIIVYILSNFEKDLNYRNHATEQFEGLDSCFVKKNLNDT